MSKMKGIVKFYDEARGFGFVIEQETKKEYFMHATNLLSEVNENDQVSFELAEGKRGLAAVQVEII